MAAWYIVRAVSLRRSANAPLGTSRLRVVASARIPVALADWIAAPREVAYIGGQGSMLDRYEVDRWLQTSDGAFVLLEDEHPVAFATLSRAEAALPTGKVELGHLLVAPAYRRRGLGSALVNWLSQEGHRRGIPRSLARVVPDNTPALGLVNKLRFQEITTTCSWDPGSCRWFERGIR